MQHPVDAVAVWPEQELYQSVPIALAPVLGNPIALAAFGLDRDAPLPDQARMPLTLLETPALSANAPDHANEPGAN